MRCWHRNFILNNDRCRTNLVLSTASQGISHGDSERWINILQGFNAQRDGNQLLNTDLNTRFCSQNVIVTDSVGIHGRFH